MEQKIIIDVFTNHLEKLMKSMNGVNLSHLIFLFFSLPLEL